MRRKQKITDIIQRDVWGTSVKNWLIKEDGSEFISDGTEYETDEHNGRRYRWTESCSMRADADGALVRRRVGKKEYDEELQRCRKNILKYAKLRGIPIQTCK